MENIYIKNKRNFFFKKVVRLKCSHRQSPKRGKRNEVKTLNAKKKNKTKRCSNPNPIIPLSYHPHIFMARENKRRDTP